MATAKTTGTTTAKKVGKRETDLIEMVREDGKKATVHKTMVAEYRAGGYTEVK